MKIKWNDKEYEGTPQELAEYGILQDKFAEQKFHQKELKQENKLELEKGIKDVIGNFQKNIVSQPTTTITKTVLPTIFSTKIKKQRNKWKNKVWSKYVPEFLNEHPLYKQLSKRNKRLSISYFLETKLKITKVKPALIRKFKNAIWWQSYVSNNKPKQVLIKKLITPIKRSNSINWNKIALTWASLTPKPKLGIFLRKSLGYIANSRQQKRFQQELDSLMLTKKIPIKQNTPLNYSVIGLKPKLLKLRNKSFQNAKPKQHHIKRNWISIATKYLDQKFVNPQLTISKFCEQEFGNSSGTRYQKLSQTLQQITTFKKRITEPLPKPILEELSKIEPQPEQRIQNEVGTPI